MRRSMRRSRERTEWVGAIAVTPTSVAPNTNQAVNLLTVGQLEEWPGGRVSRLLGQMFISPATAPAAASGYGVFVGFSLISPAEVVDPELNLDHPWIHWDSVYPQIGGNGAADSNSSRWIGYFRIGIDLRMRIRPKADQAFIFFVKNSNSSAAAIQFSFAFRMLIAAGKK